MLEEIYIENLAVIEKANIRLDSGFNVFTGETGAGKSVLIGGINAVLGQRVSRDIVRNGTQKATVSASFCDVPQKCLDILKQSGFDIEENRVILEREIKSDGKSVARINSKMVSVAILKEIGQYLVNIHGQHDNQILLSPERHIEILDAFDEKMQYRLEDYANSFHNLQKISRQISRLKSQMAQRKERTEKLKEICEYIEQFHLKEGEDKAVSDRLNIIQNSVILGQTLGFVKGMLSNDSGGICTQLLEASAELKKQSDIMQELDLVARRIESVRIELDDISHEINDLIQSIDVNDDEYERLNNRYFEIEEVTKKFGPYVADVLNTYNQSKEELAKLGGDDENLAQLIHTQRQLLEEVSSKAKQISECRKQTAEKFVESVCRELAYLNMPDVRLEVSIEQGKLTLMGMDKVEFLISANKGEQPKPIAKIASGGELSRIMLALKSVLAGRDDIPTLIFDEIDTGVSGNAAQKIAGKLAQIADYRQVICVTHLAQIAVKAGNHILIEKHTDGNRTSTQIRTLSEDERPLEIARIISGDNPSNITIENAKEMLVDAGNNI